MKEKTSRERSNTIKTYEKDGVKNRSSKEYPSIILYRKSLKKSKLLLPLIRQTHKSVKLWWLQTTPPQKPKKQSGNLGGQIKKNVSVHRNRGLSASTTQPFLNVSLRISKARQLNHSLVLS
jgi:hypothetical protein